MTRSWTLDESRQTRTARYALTSRLGYLRWALFAHSWGFTWKERLSDSSVAILHTKNDLFSNSGFVLEEVYTLPKAHFMEQLTKSKRPINEHDTKQNRARLMLGFPIQTAESFNCAPHIHRNRHVRRETSQTLHFLPFLLAWKCFHVSKYKAKVM